MSIESPMNAMNKRIETILEIPSSPEVAETISWAVSVEIAASSTVAAEAIKFLGFLGGMIRV